MPAITRRVNVADVLTSVVALCAIIVTVLVLRRYLNTEDPQTNQGSRVHNWAEYARLGHRSGSAQPTVVITEFLDFECGACRLLDGELDQLQARFRPELAIVRRHYPLQRHTRSRKAAVASECAALQGHFDDMRVALFSAQKHLGDHTFDSLARVVGVRDLAAFDRCMRDTMTTVAIHRDSADGNRIGLRATPTYLINDQLFVGWVPNRLERSVVTALNSAR